MVARTFAAPATYQQAAAVAGNLLSRMQAMRQLPLLLGLLLMVGCSSVGTKVPGIANFAKVDDGLYRGAQPTREGYRTLAHRGVKTVIDLRDDALPDSRSTVETAGMRYVRIGTNAARVEPAKVRAFLQEVAAAPKPIYVHCMRGRDRTGLEVAVYRIVEQGWKREDAINELYAHGHLWALFPGIVRYVETFDPAEVKPAGEAHSSRNADRASSVQ